MGSLEKGHRKHNLRQRKKLRRGEFQELAFEVTAKLAKPIAEKDRDAWMEKFMKEAMDANQLVCGAGLNDDGLWAWVMLNAVRGSVSEEQRAAVGTWLKAQPELKDVVVGDLRDANY